MGFDMTNFTLLHVAIGLAAIGSGVIILIGLLTGKRLDGWTPFFLATTVLTSVTGFGFPFERLLPSHIIGGLSLVILAVAIFARYVRKLAGGWRRTYVITAISAFYLNVFVLIVQIFLNVPALKAIAPTQSEAPFLLTQLIVLTVFVVLGFLATNRFREKPDSTA